MTLNVYNHSGSVTQHPEQIVTSSLLPILSVYVLLLNLYLMETVPLPLH